jgi:hypothetical protein
MRLLIKGELTPTEFARQWTATTNRKPHSHGPTNRIPSQL